MRKRRVFEVQLAGEIHKFLVPSIHERIEDYEFHATTFPSGMVGGDLVDVIACNGRWFAYVADVSSDCLSGLGPRRDTSYTSSGLETQSCNPQIGRAQTNYRKTEVVTQRLVERSDEIDTVNFLERRHSRADSKQSFPDRKCFRTFR